MNLERAIVLSYDERRQEMTEVEVLTLKICGVRLWRHGIMPRSFYAPRWSEAGSGQHGNSFQRACSELRKRAEERHIAQQIEAGAKNIRVGPWN